MVKGIAVVLLRVLAVSFIINAIYTISWGVYLSTTSDPSQSISLIVYGAAGLLLGLVLIVVSGPFGRLVGKGLGSAEQEPVSEETLITVGSALLGVYFIVSALSEFAPELWRWVSLYLSQIPDLARNHGADMQKTPPLFPDTLIESTISALVKAILGVALIFFRIPITNKLRTDKK
ncbi:hypothetical protein [Aquisalinus flavus]|uniref:DUF4199 domain-containing protein n=1 Tax=Aquisalinus flavus TaxID=1526572 RepID=A0A8J2V7I5_9PROT|nr:hypothetical protein [Aquisalinus flavus]MBD0426387.1 hypothetical protein [Aquisalinus flavus]UNE48052.1 hypothetical protein FF099_08325 [Aquisalinus flavus]GGD08341.1 hypothetical protein GCM10011342_16490 [Aquisalinus flavus]